MPHEQIIDGGVVPRFYQAPYMAARERDCKFLCWVMHRRGGKDRTALAQACRDAFRRVGLYWHCLPTLKQGKKVVWDNITADGQNLIKQTFPDSIIKKKVEDEMKLELVNGSIVQIVGADYFTGVLGANPVHVTFSEWSLTDPRAYDYIRPILRENKGSVAFIYTPRGYNHGWTTFNIAKKLKGAFVALMTINDTGVLGEADMALERAMGMPDDLIQQEYYCDFAASNIGAIVGKYISQAEREGRLNTDTNYFQGSRIVVSSDIGYRDTAAWWWWQLELGGFSLIDYDEGSGLDAQEWITRLKGHNLPIDTLYLPHDAKAKTMATKYSVIEQMAQAFNCQIVPQTRVKDRINAARNVLPRCNFHTERCERGLDALRAWSFEWDDERKIFSMEPEHNWASHGSDGFSYGAQVVREMVMGPKPEIVPLAQPLDLTMSLEELFEERETRLAEMRL